MQQQQQQQIILPTLDLSQPSQTHSQSQQDLQRVLAENLNLQLRHHMLMRQYRPVLQRTNIVMKVRTLVQAGEKHANPEVLRNRLSIF
jgi:hypothetical protein